MGLTYQDFKRLGINSIVLEKQENIEIQQNSSSYSRKQRQLIRERFYKQRAEEVFNEYYKNKESYQKTYEFKDYSNRIASIRNSLLHSIGREEEKQREFEHKVDETSSQLEYLELAINHEIEKLQTQSSSKEIRMENKMERKQEDAADITWAENFASNCKQNMAKEKFSLQHQGVSMSPRYGSNPDVALRPKTRSVGSQIASFIRGMDKGAKGDHNSYNSLKNNKLPDCYCGLKDVLLTPSIHRQHDECVNCCFTNACVNPTQTTCCCANRAANGLVCHHHNFQQTGVQPYGQYNYCRDEYYYDCSNCDKKPQAAATCPCQQKANGRNAKKGHGRHGTDLNTEEFYCRPKSRSNSKSKERKKEAYGEQGVRHKRSTSQSKSSKSKGKSSEELKLEKFCRETGSKLVKHLDRYADDYKKRLDGLLNKEKNGDSYSTTTTGTMVKISSASNICRITVQRKHHHHHHHQHDNEKSTENADTESPYSLETLRMLKKMKIRKYVAAKPHDKHKEKDRTSLDNRLEKLKNYYDYLEKYKKDEKTNEAIKGSSTETLKILKEPPTVFEQTRSEKMLQQQKLLESFPGEESIEKRYEYGPEEFNDETDSYQKGKETEIKPQPSPSPGSEKSRRKKRSLEESNKSLEVLNDTASAEKDNIEKVQPRTLANQDDMASSEKVKTELITQPGDLKENDNEIIKKEEKETQYRESDALDETDGGYSAQLSSSLNNFKVKEEPIHGQQISDGYAKGRPNSPGNSVSSSYREFRDVMDRNLGFQVERSSQTAGCCTDNEMNQPVSNKTFTRETHPVQCQMPIDSEEALKYLKLFLDSQKDAQLGEQTLTTVRSAAHQLITKVSVHNKSVVSIGEEHTSGTVYKDPESTPVNSQLQREAFEPTTMRYHYQNCPNEQLWQQTNEEYQNHMQYQETIVRSLTPPADFIDNEQYPYDDIKQMPTNEQYLEEDVPELPIEYNDGYEEAAAYQPEINTNLATTAPYDDYAYDDSYYRQEDVNQNIYSPRFQNTREEPCCSRDILPIKGILKPCRAIENNEQVCCDITTKRRTSTVSFEHEDHINTQTETLLCCTTGQQQMDHQRNENFQTVVTRNENMPSLMECCSELREATYSSTGQFLCPDNNQQNANDLCCGIDNTNNQFLYTVDSPSFRQCPCMLATYLKMLETYYRAGNT